MVVDSGLIQLKFGDVTIPDELFEILEMLDA